MFVEDKVDFTKWDTKYGGKFTKQKHGKIFDFEEVQNRHNEIRERIGGISLNKEYTTEEVEHGISTDYGSVGGELYNDLLKIIPRLHHSFYSEYDGFLPRNYFVRKLHGGERVSRLVVRYAEKIGKSKEDIDKINIIMSKFGELWAASKASARSYHVVLSTASKAFLLLGKYGPDNGSCFGIRGCNRHHAYNLSRTKNSFVVLIKDKKGRVETPMSSKITLGRMWGWYNEKENVINFCNLYRKQIQPEVVYQLSQKIAQDVIKSDSLIMQSNRLTMPYSALYHNAGQFDVSYSDKPFGVQTPNVYEI